MQCNSRHFIHYGAFWRSLNGFLGTVTQKRFYIAEISTNQILRIKFPWLFLTFINKIFHVSSFILNYRLSSSRDGCYLNKLKGYNVPKEKYKWMLIKIMKYEFQRTTYIDELNIWFLLQITIQFTYLESSTSNLIKTYVYLTIR